MNILNRLQTAVLAILMLGTLTGCGGGAASGGETGSGDPVRIATKPMTEQYILGEMLGLLIEQAGYDVEITKGVGGGTSNIQPAMESGEFDLYRIIPPAVGYWCWTTRPRVWMMQRCSPGFSRSTRRSST